MSTFKVYYASGNTYLGPVENAPAFDVQVIVEADKDHGRKLVAGGDFYVFDDLYCQGRWLAVDYFGMVQYLARPGWKKVLIGSMVSTDRWNRIVKRAREDPGFPAQTALSAYETTEAFDGAA